MPLTSRIDSVGVNIFAAPALAFCVGPAQNGVDSEVTSEL